MTVTSYTAQNGLWTSRGGSLDPGTGSGPVWPGGSYVPSRTIFGTSMAVPTTQNVSPDLDPYRNKTKEALFDFMQVEYGGLIGVTNPFKVFHGYSSGSPPSSWGGHEVSMIDSRTSEGQPLMGAMNTKGSDSTLLAGNFDSNLQGIIDGAPSGRNIYWCWNHERDNDSDFLNAGVAQTYREAIAYFCKYIIDHRGAKRIIPGLVTTNWNVSSRNGANLRAQLDVSGELAALSVDPDEVFFGTDGYDTSPIALNGSENLFENVIPWTRGTVGIQRFCVFEGSAKTYIAADRSLGAAWMRDMADMAIRNRIEMYLWFMSGIGNRTNQTPDNEGWWIYGTANKTQFAQLCANLYPAVIV